MFVWKNYFFPYNANRIGNKNKKNIFPIVTAEKFKYWWRYVYSEFPPIPQAEFLKARTLDIKRVRAGGSTNFVAVFQKIKDMMQVGKTVCL